MTERARGYWNDKDTGHLSKCKYEGCYKSIRKNIWRRLS